MFWIASRDLKLALHAKLSVRGRTAVTWELQIGRLTRSADTPFIQTLSILMRRPITVNIARTHVADRDWAKRAYFFRKREICCGTIGQIVNTCQISTRNTIRWRKRRLTFLDISACPSSVINLICRPSGTWCYWCTIPFRQYIWWTPCRRTQKFCVRSRYYFLVGMLSNPGSVYAWLLLQSYITLSTAARWKRPCFTYDPCAGTK